DLLDDHGAVETVAAIRCRQAAGNDDGAGRHATVRHGSARPVIDLRALSDEHTHAQHGILLDDDAFDDFGSCADEAVVLDDGGVRLQRFKHAADAYTA